MEETVIRLMERVFVLRGSWEQTVLRNVPKGNTDQPAPSIAHVDLFPKDVTPLPGNAFVFLGTLVTSVRSPALPWLMGRTVSGRVEMSVTYVGC